MAGKAVRAAALALGIFISLARADLPQDKVTNLPGLDGDIPFPFYSGFLNVGGKYMVHYEFHGSTRSPGDPVVLWQQGGPGSSSTQLGALTEMGPYHLGYSSLLKKTNGAPTLLKNPYAWNKMANMLYFEHPPGVGYSYCTNSTGELNECPVWTDTTAAEVLADTIVEWFEQFKEFQGYNFRISGESYAGIYVPSTALALSKRSLKFNLDGLLVGNGCINVKGATEENLGNCNGYNRDQVEIDVLFYHSLISMVTYKKAYTVCKFPQKEWRTLPPGCQAVLNAAQKEAGNFDPYYINDGCPGPVFLDAKARPDDRLRPAPHAVNHLAHGAQETPSLEEMLRTNKNVSTPIPMGGQPYQCGAELVAAKWSFLPNVAKALNLAGHPIPPPKWFKYTPFGFSSIEQWPGIIDKYRTVIYNGVSDTVCPWPQNEQWVRSLDYKITSNWTTWTTSNGAASYGMDEAGYHTAFISPKGGKLDYVTVKDAGHMVPQYQPHRGFEMFKRFMDGVWE